MNVAYLDVLTAGQWLVDAAMGSTEAQRDLARTWLWLLPPSAAALLWDDAMAESMEVIRSCFPQRYPALVALAETTSDYDSLARFIVGVVDSDLGYEYELDGWAQDEIEILPFGIPFMSHATHFLEDAAHQDINAVMRTFGLLPPGEIVRPPDDDEEGEGEQGENPEATDEFYRVRKLVKRWLLPSFGRPEDAIPCNVLGDITMLVQWLFSMTGNTSLDMTEEEFQDMEMGLLQWCPDNLKLMREIQQEAEKVVAAAFSTMKAFRYNRFLWADFARNVRYMLDGQPDRIQWSNSVRYHRYRSSTRYSHHIPVWDHAAQGERAWRNTGVSRQPLGARRGARRECAVRDRSFAGEYGLRRTARERTHRGGIPTSGDSGLVPGRLGETAARADAGLAHAPVSGGNEQQLPDMRGETASAA